MSYVEFKKCLCPLFLNWPCPLSPLGSSYVVCRPMSCPLFFLPCHSALCRMLILRNGHVAVSNLRVKSPTSSSGRLMNRISQAPPGEWDLYSQPTGAEPGGRWAGRG